MLALGVLVILTCIALFLEASLFSLPLLLGSLIVLSVLTKDSFVYAVAFILGLLLDSMLLAPLGRTSLFFLGVLLLIRLYERKFETRNLPFVIMICVLAIASYLLLFGSYVFFAQFFIGLFVSLILFLIFSRFIPAVK